MELTDQEAIILYMLSQILFSRHVPILFNHSQESYSASIHSLVQDMDRIYVRKEWKEVVFAVLEDRYMPMVREAEQEQDAELRL